MSAPEPVSVVITCYNLERYIGAAIESVISQDYRGDVEIIVVDDCSTDRSLDIAKRFAKVNVVPLPVNGGVLGATLAGFRRATHDIVMLLDGDDIWESSKVTETARAFAEDPRVALVTHDLRYIDGEGNPVSRASRVEARFQSVAADAENNLLISGILEHRDYVWLGSALSVRKLLSDIDGFQKFCSTLPDPRNTYQDWPLAFWIASMAGARLALVKKPLLNYRLHGQNYSGDSSTIAKALRNSTRSLNTSVALRTIATARRLDAEIQENADRVVAYCRFMVMCYSGHGVKAIAPFILAVRFLIREGRLSKELLRFLLYAVLRPEIALTVLNRARDELMAPRRSSRVAQLQTGRANNPKRRVIGEHDVTAAGRRQGG